MFAWLQDLVGNEPANDPLADDPKIAEPRTTSLTFSEALNLVKDGHCLQRSGWGDHNAFIFLTYPGEPDINRFPVPGGFKPDDLIDYRDYIAIYVSGTRCVVPWVPQQYDLLGSDWELSQGGA